MEEKKTVGAASSELLGKDNGKTDVVDQQMAMTKDYIDNLVQCVETHTDDFQDDFYIVVITKNERLMQNVFRNYFLARSSCPTPEYDQSVYKYVKAYGHIEYLWTVPSADACEYLLENEQQLPKSEELLLTFVKQFYDDSLLMLSKQLNGELDDKSDGIIIS